MCLAQGFACWVMITDSSDQPVHMRSLIRAFASCLNILGYSMSVKLLTELHLV